MSFRANRIFPALIFSSQVLHYLYAKCKKVNSFDQDKDFSKHMKLKTRGKRSVNSIGKDTKLLAHDIQEKRRLQKTKELAESQQCNEVELLKLINGHKGSREAVMVRAGVLDNFKGAAVIRSRV